MKNLKLSRRQYKIETKNMNTTKTTNNDNNKIKRGNHTIEKDNRKRLATPRRYSYWGPTSWIMPNQTHDGEPRKVTREK